jgi:imidazole glycerol-phosphate synthase subunit HisF
LASKRLIASIFVKNGIVVKSYGFQFWRPAGHLYSALLNLDRWAVDEILVLDISRTGKIDFNILQEIKKSKIATPLIYGGGIRKKEDVQRLLDVGCDRIVLETLLHNDPSELEQIANIVGKQALIGSIPVRFQKEVFSTYFTSRDHKFILSETKDCPLQNQIEYYKNLPISELLIMDTFNEGNFGKFSVKLSDRVFDLCSDIPGKNLIWFGGLDSKIARKLLDNPLTIGVAFGNINYEKELEIPILRRSISNLEKNKWLRQVNYY